MPFAKAVGFSAKPVSYAVIGFAFPSLIDGLWLASLHPTTLQQRGFSAFESCWRRSWRAGKLSQAATPHNSSYAYIRPCHAEYCPTPKVSFVASTVGVTPKVYPTISRSRCCFGKQ